MPAQRKRSVSIPETTFTFETACSLLQSVLVGSTRRDIAAGLAKAKSSEQALKRLREAMRAHVFQAVGRRVALDVLVERLDARTRRDGFHPLHDWDGTLDQLNPDTIPVDVVMFMMDKSIPAGAEARVVAILLDYYLLYVLALVSMRVWDEGDANDNLDRLTELLHALQGSDGSGQRFAESAEILILVATSTFAPDEKAYDRLLSKIQSLDAQHRLRFALVLAAVVGSHLRFGFEATYGRDVVAMRKDNGPDYPWLLFALGTLIEAYAGLNDTGGAGREGVERERVVEGLVNGLSPDPRAFVGQRPDALDAYRDEHARFQERFQSYREQLLEEVERHQPSPERYSPLAFYFNFLHNILKAIVVDASFHGEPRNVSLNDLLTAYPQTAEPGSAVRLARTLMSYARASPDRIRGRLVPVIVYDPRKGRRAYTDTIRRLR